MALQATSRLSAAAFGIATWRQPQPAVEELRAQVKGASEHLLEVQQGIQTKNADQVDAALKAFRKSFDPVREAAKRQPR